MDYRGLFRHRAGMAIQFARNGAHVGISARRKDRLSKVVLELKKKGQRSLAVQCVTCTTIYPGFVESEIGQVDNKGRFRADWKDFRLSNLMWPTDRAVKIMLKGIKKRRRGFIVTGHGKVLAFFGKFFPGLVYFATIKGLIPGPK